MKRKLRIVFIVAPILGAVFFAGPGLGQVILRKATSGDVLLAWQAEARELDAAQPRNQHTETRRAKVLQKLAQRAIYPDGGLRDEAIEHNLNPYTLVVMASWRWRDLFGKY
jgi:hypothetical protein